MLTRRTFFASLAALAVGGGAARLRLTPPEPVIGGIDPATFPFWRSQQTLGPPPSPEAVRAQMRELFNRCRRDDGDTILELR